ncbi:hypothetical protein G6F58_013233 [Rhizopus delemar]|nr:hypothetical protein G6F58_013233 [Rhizopus delemar]
MHLRGETIKSARDVGWVQNLNAGRLMRKGVATAPADLDAVAFRQRFPLGSGSRVVLIDGEGHYAGIVQIPRVYGDGVKPETVIGELAENRDVSLSPAADVPPPARCWAWSPKPSCASATPRNWTSASAN